MAALDAIFLPAIEPDALVALELHLLQMASANLLAPTLVVHCAPRPAIALARYHLYADEVPAGDIGIFRRPTGGRAVGAGPGWIWIAIVAPDLNTIGGEHAPARGPEQIINRHVRGTLAALRAIGIDCSYPGRDAITSKRREIAMCSFECGRSGAILFESALAVSRGMAEFVAELDSVPQAGAITCPIYDPTAATTVARELGRTPGFDELARAIARGYAGGGVNPRGLNAREHDTLARRGGESGATIPLRRAPDATFNRAGRIASQLGAIEAHLEVRPDQRIARAMLTGEFIANSAGVAALESALVGVAFESAAIEAAVSGVLGADGNFFLGLGAPDACARSLARLIADAQ